MSYRKLFYACNILLLAAFAWALAQDYNAEWKPYQATYNRMMADALKKEAASEKDPKKAADLLAQADRYKHAPLEIKQVITDGLGRYDRCVTCHVAMDGYSNPSLKTPWDADPKVGLVYKAHPQVDGALVKAHPFTKYGCTVCHEGQGLATTKEDAHGWIADWERPILKGVQVQAACVKCHGNFRTLKGAEAVAKGYDLFHQHGCLGCHALNGWGQTISVDLGDISDKPLERIAGYNFERVQFEDLSGKAPVKRKLYHEVDGKPEEWNVQNWILAHLTNDPSQVTPNDPFALQNKEPIAPSPMPDFRAELSRADAEDIVAYLSGQTKEEEIPFRYHVAGTPEKEPHFADAKAHGRYVFQKYGCAGCHGLDAKAGRRRFNALGAGQKPYDEKLPQADLMAEMEKGREPTLPDLMGTYSHDELVSKIATGVAASAAKVYDGKGPMPVVYMPAWKEKISKPELDDLATWLLSTAKKDESGF